VALAKEFGVPSGVGGHSLDVVKAYPQRVEIEKEWTNAGYHIKDQLRLFFGLKVDVKSFGGEAWWAFRLNVKDKDSKTLCNIADAGFGYSQLLPIIVQGLSTPEGDLFIAEQPEIHLNPGLQSVLGDFFCTIGKKNKKKFE
jgi:predicted ATPase